MKRILLTTLCVGLSMCTAALATTPLKPHSETAYLSLKALPAKETKRHETYAAKIRAAAQSCAAVHVEVHRIRTRTPEKREYTLSASDTAEICRILSTVQALKYKEHVFITPAYNTIIRLLDTDGKVLCTIRKWDIGRLSFITQHNEVIISEEDYKRFIEIVK